MLCDDESAGVSSVIVIVDVDRALFNVVAGWVVLGEVVSTVGGASLPVHAKLALADPVSDPVKSHIHGFGSLLFDGVIGNAISNCIVGLYGGGPILLPS